MLTPREFNDRLYNIRRRAQKIESKGANASQYGAEQFREFEDSLKPEGSTRIKYAGLSTRAQKAAIKRLEELEEYKSLTTRGAKNIRKHELVNLGSSVADYTTDEKSAVFSLVKDIINQYRNGNGTMKFDSDQMMAMVTSYLDGARDLEFYMKDDKLKARVIITEPDGTTREAFSVEDYINEEEEKRIKDEASRRHLNRKPGTKLHTPQF